jgi:hypothetical protein
MNNFQHLEQHFLSKSPNLSPAAVKKVSTTPEEKIPIGKKMSS